MLTYLILVFGLTALFLGGDMLVKGASGLALRFGLSPMVIGLTVVGFGTSAPELLVSLEAALGGQSGIAIGNVLGSNIANTLLILGLAAVLAPIVVNFRTVRRDLGWMVAATLVLPLVLWSGDMGRIEGLVLVAGLVVFLVASLQNGGHIPDDITPTGSLWRSLVLTLGGLVALMVGAHYLVQSATIIARDFGVSEAMIGLSIVAIGTSLPELATTITAVIRGQRDIAIGNVIGSNIFNILGILGLTALVTPIPVAARFMAIDIPFLFGLTAVTVGLLWLTGRLGRITGIIMLLAYAAYLFLTANL
ncbi:cation:H+ antiporter [Yoonia rosea]|uniref:Cation:H+ antiporter n=1 Tax=Yoonia rosea TaxID=287098 RepID=A0A1R3WNV4_9RHOB|nr:calcium/sodium antiporter [Yoonia rosea]SIT79840.1 cation:H+ antiporter [Yoonia rosea]